MRFFRLAWRPVLSGLLLFVLLGLAGRPLASPDEGRRETQATRPDTTAPAITHGPILGRRVNIHWSSFWKDDVPDQYRQQPYYTVVSVQNVFKNPGPETEERWVAYPEPRVVVRFYDGLTGELAYAESVPIKEPGSASK